MQLTSLAVYVVIFASCSFFVHSTSQNETGRKSGGIAPNMWTNFELASYADAQADCLTTKDSLLQIDTSRDKELIEWAFGDEQEILSQIWLDTKSRNINNSVEFFWANGEEIDAELWAPGEPSQRTSDTKIIAFWIGTNVFLKTDSNPNEDKNYICE